MINELGKKRGKVLIVTQSNHYIRPVLAEQVEPVDIIVHEDTASESTLMEELEEEMSDVETFESVDGVADGGQGPREGPLQVEGRPDGRSAAKIVGAVGTVPAPPVEGEDKEKKIRVSLEVNKVVEAENKAGVDVQGTKAIIGVAEVNDPRRRSSGRPIRKSGGSEGRPSFFDEDDEEEEEMDEFIEEFLEHSIDLEIYPPVPDEFPPTPFSRSENVMTVLGCEMESTARGVICEKLKSNTAVLTDIIAWGVQPQDGFLSIDIDKVG